MPLIMSRFPSSAARRFVAVAIVFLALGSAVQAAAEGNQAEKPAAAAQQRAALPALAKIDFNRAMQTALATVPGAVLKGELEVENERLMYSFDIVTPNRRIKEVEIDARTGRVIDVDED